MTRSERIQQRMALMRQIYVHDSVFTDEFDREQGCEAIVKLIAWEIFGSFPGDKLYLPYDWADDQYNGADGGNNWHKYSKDYIPNITLEPGDIILGKYSIFEHAAMVDRIEGNNLYVVEAVRHDENDERHYVNWGPFNYSPSNYPLSKVMGYLEMVYKPPRKKITFETNGGYMEPNVYEYEMFDNIGYLPTPVKQNYTFVGWFPSKDSEREQYSVYNVVEDSQDQTLYARWSDRYYLCRAGRYLTTASPSTGPETGKRIFTRVGDRSVSWCISDGGGVQTIRYSPDVNYSIGMSCDGETYDESPNNAILRYHTAKEVAGLIKVLYPSDNCYTCRIYHDYLKMYLTGYDNGYVRWEKRTKQNEDYQVWTIVEA